MGTTANFGFPYPDSTSNVNLWEHFEALADAVDTALEVFDDENDALAPSEHESSDNNAAPKTVSTSTAKGDTTCGVAFVAPPSGNVQVFFDGVFQRAAGTGQLYMGPEVKTGSTVGSGTVVFAPTADPGAKVGTSGSDLIAGSCQKLITGLTAGSSYNVCAVYFAVSPSSMTMNYFSRRVTVIPLH